MAERFNWPKINRLRRVEQHGGVSAYADLDPPRSWSERFTKGSVEKPAPTKNGYLISENERLHDLQAGRKKPPIVSDQSGVRLRSPKRRRAVRSKKKKLG